MDTPSAAPSAPASRRCLNCGRSLDGSWCAGCGQHDSEVLRPLLTLLRDLVDAVVDLDGRAWRTLGALLLRPGFLTREYFAGRRTRWTPPLRLFLAASIGFFLILTLLVTWQSMRRSIETGGETPAAAEAVLEIALDREDETDGEDPAAADGEGISQEDREAVRAWFRDTARPWLTDDTRGALLTALGAQVEENVREMMEGPRDFFADALENVTFFILLMVPLLALTQKLLLFWTGHYYIEHLVLTLHNHAFVICMAFLVMVLDELSALAVPLAGPVFSLLSTAATIWIVVYLFLSLRFYFRRHWAVTGFVFVATSLIYLFVLAFGLLIFGALLFIFS